MIIREYVDSSDRPAVVAMWRQIFGYATAHNDPGYSIDQKLRARDRLFFVAEDRGAVIGTVLAGYDGHRGWIYSLAVTPECRRQGIGRRLMDRAMAELEIRGCPKINLQVLKPNADVVGFYEKLGFAVEPRISMGKKLTQS